MVFVSFEEQWARLLNIPNLDDFVKKYQLVIAPTWCPPHSTFNYLFPRVYPGKIVTTISSPRDLEYLPRISQSYLPVELYASNWVNPDLYRPRPHEVRDIDILMVANFGIYKRHFALFKALSQIDEPLRVVLVGQPNGKRTSDVLMAEAEAYGVADTVELKERVSNDELVDLLCRAKTSIILSKREGSCVAVVESMFADTPVGILEEATIGSKVFVNDQTGRLLRSNKLVEDLVDFVRDSSQFSPRQWVVDNGIDCHGSSERLNVFLKELTQSRGETWTRDIYVHHWRPDPQILKDEEREQMASEARSIKEAFGVQIG